MQKYARIENGIVFEVYATDLDIASLYNLDDPAQNWVACPDNVEQGYTYNGTNFAPPVPVTPPPPTQEEILAAKLAAGYHDATLNVTIAIDPASQADITAIGVSAKFDKDDGVTDGGPYPFPTPDGAPPYVAPDAATAYDLARRVQRAVTALKTAAAAGTLTP